MKSMLRRGREAGGDSRSNGLDVSATLWMMYLRMRMCLKGVKVVGEVSIIEESERSVEEIIDFGL